MELEVRIERLGAQGDGMARGPDGPLLVPFTLPGELVSVAAEPGENHAKSLAILEPSGERVAPVCPHFAPAAAAPFSVWRPVPTLPGSASRWSGRSALAGSKHPSRRSDPCRARPEARGLHS